MNFRKKLEKIQERLKKKNEKFEKLSPEKQRVEIAKDALKYLEKGNFIPQKGTYCDTYTTNNNIGELEYNDQLNVLVEANEVTCNVCAKGILFITHVMFTNKLNFGEFKSVGSGREIQDRLQGIFTKTQLDLIETAFEKEVIVNSNPYLVLNFEDTNIAKKAIKFGYRYKTTKGRIKAILNNIVKNKGEFIP